MRRLLAALLAVFGTADARELVVGDGEAYPSLANAVAASAPGDTLRVLPGTYEAHDLIVPHDLAIEGEGGVTITASRPVAKGLFVPQADFTIVNVTLRGARAPDKNGAGIRHEGGDLTAEAVTFLGNENGILATGSAEGALTVRRSLFEGNGHGDGYSHGLYQFSGASLTIADSRFVDTRVGHHVKTLAPNVRVETSSFDDAQGRTSYVVDATGGGRVEIVRNEITRRRSAEQRTLVNYDTSRGGSVGSILIEGNRIVTERPRTRLLRNPEHALALVRGNDLAVTDNGSFRRTAAQDHGRPATAPPSGIEAAPEPPPASAITEADLARLDPEQRRAARRVAAAMNRPLPSASRPQRDGLLRTPRIDRPDGAIAAFEILPDDSGQRWLTFGLPLAPGALDPGSPVVLSIGGEAMPTQLDVLATHADGSVRHAAVTVWIGDRRGSADAALRRGDPPAMPITRHPPIPPPPVIGVEGTGPDGPFRKAIELALDSPPRDRAAGPLLTAWTEVHEVTPLLKLRIDRRRYADGAMRNRLTFENHEAFRPGGRDLAYEVSVRRTGEIIWTSPRIEHYRNSGWTIVLPGFARMATVRHDPGALIASGALPPLDLDAPIAARSLASPAASPVLPGAHGPLTPYMPTSGGRPDIGLVTGWTAAWVKSQDPQALAAMVSAADVGLTIPWHWSHDDRPVFPDRFGQFWADARGTRTDDPFPAPAWSEAPGGWTPDLAHKPSLAFPAYLYTAEPVYARALAHEAAYAVTGVWPAVRGETSDLVLGDPQLRAAAWSLRALGEAAFILPNDAPMKPALTAALRRNVAAIGAALAGEEAGALAGYLPPQADDLTPPWQQDFLLMAMAQETRRGTPGADAATRSLLGFATGRVLEARAGSAYAAAPEIAVKEGGRPLQTWDSSVARTRLAVDQNRGGADDYLNVLLAALSLGGAATGSADAAAAAEQLLAEDGAGSLTDPANRLGIVWHPQFGMTRAAPTKAGGRTDP